MAVFVGHRGGGGGAIETVTGTISSTLVVAYYDGNNLQTSVEEGKQIQVQKNSLIKVENSRITISGGIERVPYETQWGTNNFAGTFFVTDNFTISS